MTRAATLTSLAMLKVNAEVKGWDYLDYLVPFVEYVLTRNKRSPITSLMVQQLLETEFGLDIPLHANELVLKRLTKRGHLEKSHGAYHLTQGLAQNDIEPKRVTARRHQSVVVEELRNFVRTKYEVDWSEEKATSAIIEHLSHFSIDFLRTYSQGCALPAVRSSGDKTVFMVNSFVQYIESRVPHVFNSFIVFVKGHMLANALICSDLSSLPRKFSGVTFYLDTPLILRFLGLNNEIRQRAASELFDLLRQLKGSLAVFDHTVREVEGVLEWSQRNISNMRGSSQNRRNRFFDDMRRTGWTATDLAVLNSQLEKKFGEALIIRRPTPKYVAQFQIDENVLQETLDEEVKYWKNSNALEYDVNSIRSIYALRKNISPIYLEDAGAVLVTSNAKLARVAYTFGREQESSHEISPVITDLSLANIAWLKAPLSFPDVPKTEVMAACYAAMEPNELLWSQYVAEIDRLERQDNITPMEHQALRYSVQARNELMNLTLGSEEEFSASTIDDILERLKAEWTEEKEQALREERERSLAQTAEVNRQVEDERTQRTQTEAERDRIAQEKQAQETRLSNISRGVARWVSRGVLAILAATLLTGSAYSAFYSQSIVADSWWLAWITTTVIVFVILWLVVSEVKGISLKDVANRVEQQVYRKVFRFLNSNSS